MKKRKGGVDLYANAKKLRHVGYRVERCRFGLLERIFCEEWQKECRPARGINFGFGLLQDLFIEAARAGSPWAGIRFVLIPSQREAYIVATVVQWLGTNVGFAFLLKCLNKAGLTIRPLREGSERSNQYYSEANPRGRAVRPGDYGYSANPSAWRQLSQRDLERFNRPSKVKAYLREHPETAARIARAKYEAERARFNSRMPSRKELTK